MTTYYAIFHGNGALKVRCCHITTTRQGVQPLPTRMYFGSERRDHTRFVNAFARVKALYKF